jgi:hypothetical protein
MKSRRVASAITPPEAKLSCRVRDYHDNPLDRLVEPGNIIQCIAGRVRVNPREQRTMSNAYSVIKFHCVLKSEHGEEQQGEVSMGVLEQT